MNQLTVNPDLLPVPGTRLFLFDPEDEEGVLFSPVKRDFFRLSPLATLIWCALEEGVSWSGLAETLDLAGYLGVSSREVEEQLEAVATRWIDDALLYRAGEDVPLVGASTRRMIGGGYPAPRFEDEYFDFCQHSYRVLGMTFRIRFGDRELVRWVHPALAHLEVPVEGPVDHTLVAVRILDYLFLFCDDRPMPIPGAGSLPSLVQALRDAMLGCVLERQDFLLRLGGAAIVRDGRTIMLPGCDAWGPLTARLLAEGCTYLAGGDMVLRRRDGSLLSAPLPLPLTDDEAEWLALYDSGHSDRFCEHEHPDRGQQCCYLPLDRSRTAEAPQRPDVIVFVDRLGEGASDIHPLPAIDAFSRLMRHRTGQPEDFGPTDAECLISSLGMCPSYLLSGGNPDTAVERILEICPA